MKVSKVVMIVVALHVLVIGGIFVFEGCSRAKKEVPDSVAQAGDEESATQSNSVANNTPDQPASMTPAPSPAVVSAPAPATTAVVTPPATTVHATTTYVVKKNDTLWKIAKAEHVKVGDLARANNLTKTAALKVNQKLTIPAKAEAAPTQTAAVTPNSPAPADVAAPAPASGNVYVVKSGDSLWKIARAQNISVASLKQANNLTSDALKVNQKLNLPAAATSAVGATGAQASASPGNYDAFEPGKHNENGQTIHVVDINETPSGIAKKYGVKLEDLMKANNITDGKRVTAGQKLVIPIAAAPVTATAPTPAMAAPIVTSNN